jgi:3',5'-cyclic AMP phosphodiesterase CpdA
MTRVIQISDSHLSPTKRHFVDNWMATAAWVAAQRPDLVIHTGDVTVDGADLDEDLGFCAGLLAKLGVPVLALPGNHDVGDAGHRHQPVNDARIERWNRHFGADRWIKDIAGWRLIGFNALLINSGEQAERDQEMWLTDATASASPRRVAWFLHRPLFLETPQEGDTGYWSVKPVPRARLMALVHRHGVALVASGHLHKSHDFMQDGVRYVWGPSCGFVVGPKQQPPMPGEARLGAIAYAFSNPDVVVRIAAIDGLTAHVIDDVIHEVYPPRS